MALSAAVATDLAPQLSPFESTFVRAVLEHRGVSDRPTLPEFTAALTVLHRYQAQREDNPGDADLWRPALDEDTVTCLSAKAYLMFGATKPTAAQWQKAHAALYGPLLCEWCD